MKKCIAVPAGDGIGPEIMKEGLKVLDTVAKKFGHTISAFTQIIPCKVIDMITR